MTGIELFEKMEVIEDQYIDESLSEDITFGKKKKHSWIWIATSVAAAFVLAFVGVVNAFPGVAVAMNDVVGLKELVQLVTVDESMKACLENEYAQYIGEEQIMKDGHYSKVYYVVADKTHISIFYKTDVPYKGAEYHHFANVFCDDESPIVSIWSVNSYETDIKDLYELRITFLDELKEDMLPESIQMVIDFGKTWEDGYATEEGGFIQQPEATATFEIKLDNVFFVEPVVYDIQEEIKLDGQRILFEKIEAYPTMTRLYYSEDSNNIYELMDIDVILKDDKGNEYEKMQESDMYIEDETGVIGTATSFASSYFDENVSLQLEIRGVSWDYGTSPEQDVSYETKSVGGLPEEIELLGMEMDDDKTLTIQFRVFSNDDLGYFYELYNVETGDYAETISMEKDTEEGYWIHVESIPYFKEGEYVFRWGKQETKKLDKPIQLQVK